MQPSLSNIFGVTTKYILKLTLYHMMRSSYDFEDVKTALNDRTDWSIELFRSCFTIHLSSGSYAFTLCTLSFLFMAEGIHIHYGRLSPSELKERAENMGYATFAILFALLDISVVVVRIVGLVVLSTTPGVAAGLVLVGVLPSVILPLSTYAMKICKRRKRGLCREGEVEAGIIDETQK